MSKLYTKTITTPTGKRKYIRATTKEELERKYQQAKLEIGAGVDITDATTFGEFAQLWFNTYKRPSLRENSKENLLYILNHYIMPQLAAMRLRDIKPVHIRGVMSSLTGYSRSVQSKTVQVLRSIFNAAVENHLLLRSPVSPALKAGGAPAEERVPLTPEQSQRLLDATAGTRAYPAVALMLGAGLRKEEAVGLMWEDIDLKNGYIHVRHAKPFHHGKGEVTDQLKSKAAYRTIPIPAWLLQILRGEHSKTNSLFVLAMRNGESLTESSFSRLWGIIQARTTDDPEKIGTSVSARHPNVIYMLDFHVHPHLLRHTCITRWVESGLDVKEIQYLAGHATPDMTMRVYAHYDRLVRLESTAEKVRTSTRLSAPSVSIQDEVQHSPAERVAPPFRVV